MASTEAVLPSRLLLKGAGSAEVNGEYLWAGSVNGRPFWQHNASEICVWYFKSSNVLAMAFDGWYVSKRAHTSWSSASEDYYCAYDSDHPASKTLLMPPFSSSWTVRDSRGLFSFLVGGCGASPAPVFCFACEDLHSMNQLLQPHVPPAVRLTGCGLSYLNGIYVYSHLVNDRPCWLLRQQPNQDESHAPSADHSHQTQAALWYFSSPSSLSSAWNGWYVSLSSATSSFSAANDFYASYCDAPLPPTSGWITRQKGSALNPTAGRGVAPPPSLELLSCNPLPAPSPSPASSSSSSPPASSSARHSLTVTPSSSTLASVPLITSPFPCSVTVASSGCSNVNGTYTHCGVHNARPYYRKLSSGRDSGGPVLWYFYSRLWDVGNMMPVYNGWYISDNLETSSVSAKQDYYSCRGQQDLPFDYAASSTTPSQSFSWIPITSSILPTGGCGVAPPPSVLPSPGCASLRHVVIQRPIGHVIHLYSPTTSSVAAIKLHIQKTCRLPAHCQRLSARNCHCDDDATLDAIFPATNREACFFTLEESTYIELINTPLVESCRTIAIIGGGPVGLWIALQVKLLAESWDVHVFEKRDAYARSHALRLLPLAFEGLLREHRTSAMCDMVDRWLAAGSSPRTNVIENELSDQCEAAGVQIHRKQGVVLVSDVKSRLVSLTKHTLSACVCCDGVGSMNRPLLLSGDQCEFAVDENFEGVGLLQVKFQARGRVAQVKGTWAKFLQNLPASEVVFNILAGNYDACSDTTPVTVFAMLTDRDLSTEFSHVMEGVESFKGMSFDELQAHSHTPHTQQLVLDISAVLQPLFPSGLSHDPAHPLRISRLPVRVCIAARVVGEVERVPVFIAGDAAMGLSLEKGLSYGWHLATALCKSLRFCTSVGMAQEEYAAAFDAVSVSAQRHVEHDFHAYESLIKRAGLLRNILKKVTLGAANSQFVVQKASQKAISKSQQKK